MSGRDDDQWIDGPGTDRFDEPDTDRFEGAGDVNPDALRPDAPADPADGEVSNPEAVRLFPKLVVVFDVALIALALGPMLVVFQDRWELGVQVFAAGVLAFGYGTAR